MRPSDGTAPTQSHQCAQTGITWDEVTDSLNVFWSCHITCWPAIKIIWMRSQRLWFTVHNGAKGKQEEKKTGSGKTQTVPSCGCAFEKPWIRGWMSYSAELNRQYLQGLHTYLRLTYFVEFLENGGSSGSVKPERRCHMFRFILDKLHESVRTENSLIINFSLFIFFYFFNGEKLIQLDLSKC